MKIPTKVHFRGQPCLTPLAETKASPNTTPICLTQHKPHITLPCALTFVRFAFGLKMRMIGWWARPHWAVMPSTIVDNVCHAMLHHIDHILKAYIGSFCLFMGTAIRWRAIHFRNPLPGSKRICNQISYTLAI